uniref:myomegalin n=1 Tax=Monopterus albus TaxID=43700 RepID=UPI0009B3B819|nr:myomegalin-like [Monopterus albus]
MSNGYRTLSQHLNDLKKENFSLKLRIYFLEERIQQKYEESSEDVYRTNIELKVEVESLKQELQDKQQLLDKALITAENLTNHNEAELQRRCQERQQEIDHMQQVLETKIQLLQEEAQLARSEAERMASLAGSHSHTSLHSLDTPMEDIPEDERPPSILSPSNTNKDRVIEQLTKELHSKEALITDLSREKTTLTRRVGELEGQVQELSSSLLQKDKDVEFYQEELSQERLRIEQEMQTATNIALLLRVSPVQSGEHSAVNRTGGTCGMLDLKMKEACRICGRELCGNQRRWIFHPAAKLNLQVLLSHALGQELTRDGRGEFACSKCTFMLDRMYRFDTVIARVEALSIERLQRLLQEKHRLRQCISGLYRKTNSEETAVTISGGTEGPGDGMVDISGLTHAKYCALLQDDLVYSLYESWADDSLDCPHHHHHQCPAGPGSEVTVAGPQHCAPSTPRRCRACSYWRVADSDYEAVCKVPRKLARSTSCGPSTRYSASVIAGSVTGGDRKNVDDSEQPPSSLTLVPGSQDPSRTSDGDRTLAGRASSSPSVTSLETAEGYIQPGAAADGPLGSPREPVDDRILDSVFEENIGIPHGQSSPGPSLSLALCVLQNCAVYQPVQSPKGSKLPVLLRRSSSNGGIRLGFPNPDLGMFFGERDSHIPILELETPLNKMDVKVDQMADVEDLLENLYKECPPPPSHQSLVEEQHSQLNQYECAAGQCVSELQKAQLQVQSLQAKIHESEANNMKLQEKLNEMEHELRSLRQASQSQERTIQDLTESISTKDSEAQELYQLIEGQNTTLCKLREMAHRNHLAQCKAPEGASESLTLAQLQGELVRVQSSLFSLGLELEANQRSLRQSQRQGEDLVRLKDRLNSDLQEALQHREVTEKHNQDLRCALQKTCSELHAKEVALKESEAEKHTALQEKDRGIAQLKHSLQDKERQLQVTHRSSKPRDALLEKLKERIKDRDRALERSIDDKFHCLEEHEAQVRRLQQALREKERDLERLRCILSNNEDTITSLDALVRGKELELEQAAEAYRNLQWLKQQGEEKERNAQREKDTIISQLQETLQSRSQEVQELTATLVARVQAGPTEVVEELKSRLALKEKLFQELLTDRSRQSNEHHAQVQDLLSALSSKDQYLQDYAYRLSLVISERTGQLQELRRQLSIREQELCELRWDREREMGGETEHLRSVLQEKEAFIKELMQGQEEAMHPSSKEREAEVKALEEELQLALKKEREAQKELSALHLSLARQQVEGVPTKDGTDHQCVLEQLVSEYNKLNDALRAEKRLYQNLTQIHTKTDSSTEKIQALHTELDSVQALRGQLEEVLARTRKMALGLERATKRQSDSGELSTEEEEEGDDEGNSSDEFTDSIEDDDDKVTPRSLASIRTCVRTRGPVGVAIGPTREVLSQRVDVEQLEKAKKTLEGQLEEIRFQLERDGYSSVSQMRSALQRVQQENRVLKEAQGPAGFLGLKTNIEKNPRSVNQEEEKEDIEEDKEDDEEEEISPVSTGKRGPPCVSLSEKRGKRHCTRPSHHRTHQTETEVEPAGESREEGALWHNVEESVREQAVRLRSDLALSHQENRELQERLMVSEATVHAQAEQLKDYRDLLTETSVQQVSKQVQVDLQDLGYETCGRSENEAEREDTSSPEFDDLEMCTSLSHHQHYEGVGSSWYAGNTSSNTGVYELADEPVSLQHLVQDLRSQLGRCHKVIRGLQLRVRSLSATSDYASSLERTPRKVNWAFERTPAPSGVEEDEGWMSDTQGTRLASKPNGDLQELMARVASLEAQLKSSRLEGKGQAEEEKCATWPGKYNSLIQAQARELSHLRQRMREGQGVCHILTQHLGDTTKTFEELLRANDIDYYMGQSFREQLAQSTALAQRVFIKISGRDHAESHDDKMDHELLALRLSKELQQKDKIIESLHTKLQQCPESPSSCHALSETTDQSDRTSLVSDEYRTNEDLELCSDLDAREYQEEHRLRQPGSEPDVRSSFLPPHGLLKSSSSCPNMLCSAPMALTSQFSRALFSEPVSSSPSILSGPDVWGKEVTSDPRPRALSVIAVHPELDMLYKQMNKQNRGFAIPHDKALFTLSPGDHNQHNLSSYSQLSHHAFQQYHLDGIPEGHSLKSDSGLVTGATLWDTDNLVQPVGRYSGSSGHQPGGDHAGVNLIEEHLQEVRCLRQRLEESIRTNERLRQQLEERLATTGRDGGAPTNIYIQGLDTVTQLSNEIRILKEENLGLQSRLQASTDTCEEVVQLREAVFTARARLKQAELEAKQWKDELRRLQAHSQEQGQQIHTLRQERQASQEKTNRLQHEVSLLQQQLCESRELIHSLQSELQVYDRVSSSTKANKGYICELPVLPVELGELLGEVRSLRAQLQNSVQESSALKQLELHKQLEQKLGVGSPRTPSLSALTASPQRESFYRRQLLHDPAPSPPVRDIGLFNCGSPGPPYSDLDDSHSTANDPLDPHSELEGEAPDGSFANRNGRHAIGHVDDFTALQQQVLEGRSIVQRMEMTLQACLSPPLLEGSQKQSSDLVLDYGCVKSLLSNTKTLRQILEEAMALLKMFWRAALPSADPSNQNLKKEQCMQEEILSLKLRISEQDEVLKGTIQRLRSTSRTKESMEHFIVNHLSRTRDVLKKARTNLQKNELRLSSLSSSSSYPYAAEDPGGAAREQPADCSFLKPSSASRAAGAAASRRQVARKRSSQCLL